MPSPVPETSSTAEALEGMARRLLEILGRLTGLESTYLTMIDWEECTQQVLYARNTGALEIPENFTVAWNDTLCRRALASGPMYTTDVASAFPDSPAAEALGLTTYVTAPIVANDGIVFGTVCGVSSNVVELPDDVLDVIETFAEMVALHLRAEAAHRELAAAHEALAIQAVTDALTGVSNRYVLDELLATSADCARDSAIAVVSVDVNAFKAVNDTFGHGAGDDVLRDIAAHLRANVRAGDEVIRTGGDEFLVILMDTDHDEAARISERIHLDVAAHPVTTDNGPVPVSVSVGYTSGPRRNLARLLVDVDTKMYADKRSPRR